ncbi:MAG TPA: hypothetical protein VLR26_03265 [Frankiaceae bacterium]|nr:hypothetical protein [Frankiaceae bacterium]
MTDVVVDFDSALSAGLTDAHRTAAEVHVLRARAEGLRGPRSGSRALVLAMRAGELERHLLESVGLDRGAELLREMFEHPVTVAAIERWQYAQELAHRLIFD